MIRPASKTEVSVVAQYAHRLNSNDRHRCKAFPNRYDEILNQFERMVEHPHDQLLVAEGENMIAGVLALFVDPEGKYLQAIGGVFAELDFVSVSDELFTYIQSSFTGYRMHAAYPKENEQAIGFMQSVGAKLEDYDYEFCLSQSGSIEKAVYGIEELSEAYYEAFVALHNAENPDAFWTGEKLLQALDIFKIYVAIDKQDISGFIVTSLAARADNEIYFWSGQDPTIKERLLTASIADTFSSGSEDLIIMVGKDNRADMKMLEKYGFRQTDSCLTFLLEF
ncbi:MAG: hypothetical protein DDT38_00188 [Firmicutes bacterium]|nr:hypothetical protein [candidate division NPL-UPA2 bacterium]